MYILQASTFQPTSSVEEHKKEWMTTDYPKKLNYKHEGKRNIGKPQTRWGDDFREAKGPKPYS